MARSKRVTRLRKTKSPTVDDSKTIAVKRSQFQAFDIFLSYSSLDAAIASELREEIEAKGLTCYQAEKSIGAGDVWKPSIRDALRLSEKILILVTPRSIDSTWITIEMGAGWMQEKQIIPLIMFVDPRNLNDIGKEHQARIIETREQRETFLAELASREPRPHISFATMYDRLVDAVQQIEDARFGPDIVVASGGDGAVCGAILADLLGRKPVVTVHWHSNEVDLERLSRADLQNKQVLIAEWVRQTGNTYEKIKKKLLELDVKEDAIKSFALFFRQGDTTSIAGAPPTFTSYTVRNVPKAPWQSHRRNLSS